MSFTFFANAFRVMASLPSSASSRIERATWWRDGSGEPGSLGALEASPSSLSTDVSGRRKVITEADDSDTKALYTRYTGVSKVPCPSYSCGV